MNTSNSISYQQKKFWIAGVVAVILTALTLSVAYGQSRSPEVIDQAEDGTAVEISRAGTDWTVTDLVNGTPVRSRPATEREARLYDVREERLQRDAQIATLKARLAELRRTGPINGLDISDALTDLVDLVLLLEGE